MSKDVFSKMRDHEFFTKCVEPEVAPEAPQDPSD